MVKQQRDNSLMKAVGRRLRELRESIGLSQETVLFKTGIYLTRIENGKRNISISTLIELCKVYNITLREFFKKVHYGETNP